MLEPNPTYWDPDRTPKARFVFDNVISKAEALELVADSIGKMDIVTELTPTEAQAIEGSKNARVVRSDSKTVLVGVFNQTGKGSPWNNVAARKAINMAVDREALVEKGAMGYGTVLASMIVPGQFGYDDSLEPYALDAAKAKAALATLKDKKITVVAGEGHKAIVQQLSANLSEVGLTVEPVYAGAPKGNDWDIWLVEHFDWSPEWPAGVVYREFFGEDGAFRKTASADPGFMKLYRSLLRTPDVEEQEKLVRQMNKYVHDQATVLFLYAPAKLFAVSKRVNFVPYKTTMLELAETSVNQSMALTR